MHLNNNELTVPNPKKEGDLRLRFNMKNIFDAESRVHEIAFVNPQKAPELMATFSVAIRDLSEHLAYLHYHSAVASKSKRQRRAVVVTEVIPAKLADKKLSNNDTNREAVIELDPEYSATCDVEIEVEAAFVFIREKLHSMESHLNAIKKSLDASSGMFGQNMRLVQPLGNHPLNDVYGPASSPDYPTNNRTPLNEVPQAAPNGMAVGKARY